MTTKRKSDDTRAILWDVTMSSLSTHTACLDALTAHEREIAAEAIEEATRRVFCGRSSQISPRDLLEFAAKIRSGNT